MSKESFLEDLKMNDQHKTKNKTKDINKDKTKDINNDKNKNKKMIIFVKGESYFFPWSSRQWWKDLSLGKAMKLSPDIYKAFMIFKKKDEEGFFQLLSIISPTIDGRK
jgi:hypothetical protein